MSLLSGFFGGGSSKSTPTQVQTYTPEQLALLNTLIGQAGSGVGKPAVSYPGAMSTDTLPIEQSYLDYASGAPDRNAASITALTNLLGGQPSYDVSPEATENYFQNSILKPATKTFNELTLPQLTESFAGPSFWSSNRADQTRRAITDFGLGMTNIQSNLAYQDEQSRRQALENAFGRINPAAQTLGVLGEATGQEMGTAGMYARQIANEKVLADLQRWLGGEAVGGEFNPTYNPNNALALALLGYSPYAVGATSKEEGPGLGYGLLSGLAKGAGAGLGYKIGIM